MEQLQKSITENLNVVLKNPYVMAILKVFLIIYASQLAPRVPSAVSDMFSNTFVKIIAIALLAYLSELDFQLAILLAIIFVLGNNLLARGNMMESFNPGPSFASRQGSVYIAGAAQQNYEKYKKEQEMAKKQKALNDFIAAINKYKK